MQDPTRRALRGAALLALGLALAPAGLQAQQQYKPPRDLFDPRLDDLRRASVAWDVRKGPERRVIDQVALVPDVPTFLAAIRTWDRGHYFPILLDDTEYALKFLRAFRPARVVRFAGPAPPIPSGKTWDEAVAAVGKAWAEPGGAPPAGDAVPTGLGPTTAPPPGVVLSSPDSPMLPAAVALAAGRLQPLIRWEPGKTGRDVLSGEEAGQVALDLARKVLATCPKSLQLGDDCDFLTLAGDWPYRVNVVAKEPLGGLACFDDALGRARGERWAYVGRLTGGPAASLYQAMCALFLQPESALLFDTYDDRDPNFRDYGTAAASTRLQPLLPVARRAGAQADIAGWHRAFDPVNRAGLILLNSTGDPTRFSLAGGMFGHPGDVPPTIPAVVHVIHSYSAADPTNPDTLAGRWLANGAFVYYGSINEPYLPAFRTPTLVADLIAEGLPLSAAFRQGSGEAFGGPWRLIYLGDPLYRIRPDATRATRVAGRDDPAWRPYLNYRQPPAGSGDDAKLSWALKAALYRAGRESAPRDDLLAALLSIRRDRLAPSARGVFDAILADALTLANRPGDLRARLGRIPAGEASPDVRRWLETARMADLHRALAARDLAAAGAVWDELVRSGSPDELKGRATERLGRAADSPAGLRTWRARLAATLRDADKAPEFVRAELRRVEAALGSNR
jgi:hypothetical protein